MRSPYAFLFVTALIFTAAVPTAADARCWDTGFSIRCAPGCAPTKLPRFRGDSFSWRCRRHVPPPQRYDPPPPPRQPPTNGCGPGMYPATPTWCCEIGSVFRNGRCVPERPRTHIASGQADSMDLLILFLVGLGAWAWFQSRDSQIAAAREVGEDFDADDISAAAGRINEEADRAEEILRQFRKKMEGDA